MSSSKRSRRHFTTEQKVAILKRHMVDKVPVNRIASAFAGAGSAVVAAGGLRWRRDAAFERLIEQWIAVGGDVVAPFFGRALKGEGAQPSSRQLHPGAADEHTGGAREPAEGEVVLVEYRAGSDPQPSSVLVQTPVPDGAVWACRGLTVEEPRRFGVALHAGRLVVNRSDGF